MWEISFAVGRTLRVVRFPRQDELGMSALWVTIKYLEHATCRRMERDGHVFGTVRASDPVTLTGAHRIGCSGCDKEAWSRDPNDTLCLGCLVAEYPNEPPDPHGDECISETGYHHPKTCDDGIVRCLSCCQRREDGQWVPILS